MIHGNVSAALGSSNLDKKNVKAGKLGEEFFAKAVSQDPFFDDVDVFASMRIPRKGNQKDYNTDVDFVIASGNKVILVDVKSWSAMSKDSDPKRGVIKPAVYWSAFGTIFNRFAVKEKASANMKMALDRYSEYLKGVAQVEAMVMFAPTKGRRGKEYLPASVSFLKWPGGIKSYLLRDGLNKSKKRIPGGPADKKVSQKLSSLMARNSKNPQGRRPGQFDV